MIFVLIILTILVFYWYYKTWGKEDFLNNAKRGVKGFARGFTQGVMEERIDEFRKRMNYYVIALLAKIAKSDGRVSEEEADMISQILDSNAKDERERAFLKASFNEHKDNLNDTFYVATDFLKEVPLPRNERLNVLRVLVFMALIDADFSEKKQEILNQIAKAFEISKNELDSFIQNLMNLKGSRKSLSLDEAYKILELNQNADLNLVKKQYRALAKKYHPDILNANNVSKEELEQGVQKFQKINEAYELIKKHLGA
ncbi:MAG: TerB family tellurite resistance protein [Campylobacter sp.]|nr:TerB family tellurite resistance protein [Campylobacter sp.]